ncbi:MAG: hypothetical protein MUO72_01170 [Bacteroidales bacterium]|nr:hypothetical protein [Bacteroidales bacterium]
MSRRHCPAYWQAGSRQAGLQITDPESFDKYTFWEVSVDLRVRILKEKKSIANSFSFVNLLFRYATVKACFDLMLKYTGRLKEMNY